MIDELVEANRHFADALGEVQKPALPPRRKVAIVTCIDARIVTARIFGLEESDAHVIRNAGGRTSEVLRSLVIPSACWEPMRCWSYSTPTGMLTFTNEDLYAKVEQDLGADARDIDFLPFPDLDQNVRADVDNLRKSPLIADNIDIRGFVYDVETRRAIQVA